MSRPLNSAIEALLPRLPKPPVSNSDLINLRALHALNIEVLKQAVSVEAAAMTARMHAQKAAAGSQVMLELLEEKLGIRHIVECPYCQQEIGSISSACCGEAGHGREVTLDADGNEVSS